MENYKQEKTGYIDFKKWSALLSLLIKSKIIFITTIYSR